MLSTREAFFLASTPSRVGAPLLGRALLALAAGQATTGPVADKIVFHQKVYDLLMRQADELVGELEAALRRQNLAVPARPAEARGFMAWRDAIVSSVLGAVTTGTPSSLAAMVGLTAGEVLLGESLLATALAVLTVAPEHGELAEQARRLAERHKQNAAQLAQLVALPLATPAIRSIGGELAAALAACPDLRPESVDATRAAAVREHQGRIDALLKSLAAALDSGADRVLLVPSFLLGYLPTATGVPFQFLELLAQLRSSAPPAVLTRGDELLGRLRESNQETVHNVLAVESLLRHHGLAVPARPQTAEEYFAWLSQIRKEAPGTVQPLSAAGGVLSLGFYLADLLVTLRMGIYTLQLLQVAPEYARAQAQLAASIQQLGTARQYLDLALRHPATPEPARSIGRRLADRVTQAPTLDATLPIAERLAALEPVAAELAKGKDELVALLVKIQEGQA